MPDIRRQNYDVVQEIPHRAPAGLRLFTAALAVTVGI
jgi:hypothetical protein